jgi:hypothetical protein
VEDISSTKVIVFFDDFIGRYTNVNAAYMTASRFPPPWSIDTN